MPRVTVVIPLYNKAPFVQDALRSVLAQTYRDLQVLVIDDCSTDESVQRVKELGSGGDIPIRLVCNRQNLGLAGNGNRCFDLAETELIARLDADDLMPPARIEKQVAFLDEHPHIHHAGGAVKYMGQEEKTTCFPLTHQQIRSRMPVFTGLSQGTSIWRSDAVRATGVRYDVDGPAVGEDWLFFWKLGKHLEQANLPEVMDHYRIYTGNASGVRGAVYYEQVDQVLQEILSDLGLQPTGNELQLHCWLRGQFRTPIDRAHLELFANWYDRVEQAYLQYGLDQEVLREFKRATLNRLYFMVNPKDNAMLEGLQALAPMTEVHKKYFRRKRIKRWFGLK